MRKSLPILFALFLLHCALPAQPRFCYPLLRGNTWLFSLDPTTLFHATTVTVTGDALMPNGRTYARFNCVGGYGCLDCLYQRVAGDSVLCYNPADSTESLRYIFSLPDKGIISKTINARGDTTLWSLDGRSTVPMCGRLRRQLYFKLITKFKGGTGTSEPVYWTVTDSLGLTARTDNIDSWSLISAAVNSIVCGGATGVREMKPPVFALAQNFPNPFSDQTTIQLRMTNDELRQSAIRNPQSEIRLKVYDFLGREVLDLSEKATAAGEVKILRNQLPAPGVYFYRLTTPSGNISNAMHAIK